MAICVRGSASTDASDTAWSRIITEVPIQDVSKPHKYHRHSPLSFLFGLFNATQLEWSVLEKEAFAVLKILDRMHWLVTSPEGFDLYTDYSNLIFLSDPLSVVADMSQTTLRKVLRCTVRLSIYRDTFYHIKSDDSVWADLPARWLFVEPTVRRRVHIPELHSSCAEEFEWPSTAKIATVLLQHVSTCPE